MLLFLTIQILLYVLLCNFATAGFVKELIPFTKNSLYREYFEEFYDFSDATNYNLNIGASGLLLQV